MPRRNKNCKIKITNLILGRGALSRRWYLQWIFGEEVAGAGGMETDRLSFSASWLHLAPAPAGEHNINWTLWFFVNINSRLKLKQQFFSRQELLLLLLVEKRPSRSLLLGYIWLLLLVTVWIKVLDFVFWNIDLQEKKMGGYLLLVERDLLAFCFLVTFGSCCWSSLVSPLHTALHYNSPFYYGMEFMSSTWTVQNTT